MRKRTLLSITSVCVSVLLAELVLAVFFPMSTYDRTRQNNPPIFQASDILPYQLRPGAFGSLVRPEFSTTVHINANGHRGDEFSREEDDQFRILAIGDSFTFGWGSNDDETYPAQLQRSLRRSGDRHIEVINAGFAACYYPDTYYVYLKSIGIDLAPDLVLVGFFLGNDVDHAGLGENAWKAMDSNGFPVSIGGNLTADVEGYAILSSSRRRYRYPILRNSHLFQLAVLAYRARRFGEGRLYNEWMYRNDFAPRTEKAVTTVKELLLATADVARQADVQLLVLMFPAREQLRPEAYDFAEGVYAGGFDIEKPQRIFSRFFEENEIDYLDLLPEFRERYSADILYYPQDAHWTPRGNEAVAEIVADYLLAEGFVR